MRYSGEPTPARVIRMYTRITQIPPIQEVNNL